MRPTDLSAYQVDKMGYMIEECCNSLGIDPKQGAKLVQIVFAEYNINHHNRMFEAERHEEKHGSYAWSATPNNEDICFALAAAAVLT